MGQHGPILVFVGVLMLAFLLARLLVRRPKLPYVRRESILTKTELKFHVVLNKVIAGKVPILAMVRMADIIRVVPKTPGYQGWQNRIQAKHIDFVLCDPETMEIKVAIELDDPSHQRADRQQRDAFVNEAFASAEVPLLRVPTADEYDESELKEQIGEFVQL